jgi:hypothetical protein
VDWSEKGYGPENLQVKVMNLICPGFADMSLCEQMQLKVLGKEIWKYGFWNLLECCGLIDLDTILSVKLIT